MEIAFDPDILHDSTLFKVDFSDWPNMIYLYFWVNQEAYKLDLMTVLAFQYEVSNIGEFALPAIDSHNVDIRSDGESRQWEKRIKATGFVSDKYKDVYHILVESNMLRIKSSVDSPTGMSIFCRDYKFTKLEDLSIVPNWLQKFGY